MTAAKHTAIKNWNRKLDRIWQEEPGERAARRDFASFVSAHRWELVFTLLMGCLLFFLSWVLPYNEGPDEFMRYMIPKYIYSHGTLPAGWEAEIRDDIWGISYAFHPIIPYIAGGWLMRLVSLFSSSDRVLLLTARFVNVLLGMGFYWYVLQISGKLFRKKRFRCYFIALLSLLPQLLYLFTYVNTDGIAMFSTALIVNYWLEGLFYRWDRRSCRGLAIGVAVCALSYYNAYGYALFSVFFFVGTLIVFYRRAGAKKCAEIILKRGIYITVIVLVLSGWWFVRSGILYEGDFLGMSISDKYAELYAAEDFRPSVKKSLKEQGYSLDAMLRPVQEGGLEWRFSTFRSTIAYFGYMRYPMEERAYVVHRRLVFLGGLGTAVYFGLILLWYLRRIAGCRLKKIRLPELEKPRFAFGEREVHPVCFLLLHLSLACCIVIPVVLSLIYSFTSDFQAQGRYIMPMIIPMAYYVVLGAERLLSLLFQRWVAVLLLAAQFYGVIHVFLEAFLRVYLPTYSHGLAFLANVRLPWLTDLRGMEMLLHMFLPG